MALGMVMVSLLKAMVRLWLPAPKLVRVWLGLPFTVKGSVQPPVRAVTVAVAGWYRLPWQS